MQLPLVARRTISHSDVEFVLVFLPPPRYEPAHRISHGFHNFQRPH